MECFGDVLVMGNECGEVALWRIPEKSYKHHHHDFLLDLDPHDPHFESEGAFIKLSV